MDQFKPDEMKAMELGGNQNAHDWMESHGLDLSLKLQEKYTSPVAEDYKDKLAADVQGVEWVPKKRDPVSKSSAQTRQPVATSAGDDGIITNKPVGLNPDAKARNEAYFSTLGKANESRPENLPPSQGGKYAGFGSSPAQPHPDSAASVFDNFQNDPLGSFTKGWGIFARTVTKSVDQVNETYIKPGVKNFAEGDMGQTTKKAMMQFGQKMQETGQYGIETINNFAAGQQKSRSVRSAGDSKYTGLFDDIGEEKSTSLFDSGAANPRIEPAFGIAKPKQRTRLQGLSNPNKKNDDWEQDGWEKF